MSKINTLKSGAIPPPPPPPPKSNQMYMDGTSTMNETSKRQTASKPNGGRGRPSKGQNPRKKKDPTPTATVPEQDLEPYSVPPLEDPLPPRNIEEELLESDEDDDAVDQVYGDEVVEGVYGDEDYDDEVEELQMSNDGKYPNSYYASKPFLIIRYPKKYQLLGNKNEL